MNGDFQAKRIGEPMPLSTIIFCAWRKTRVAWSFFGFDGIKTNAPSI
jgi:hypothetical protein